jgi:Cu-Zn family superoxide dismutase
MSMNALRISCFAGLLAVLPWLASPAMAQTAKAALKDQKGADVGTATLSQTKKGVQIQLSLKGLPPGERAFHVHEAGRCEPPFATAGGHFNPDKKKHGKVPGGGHAGDMPNITIGKDGTLNTSVVNEAITLAKGPPNSVFQSGGTAIVIHAGADDYKSDPAGNAGDRIACGVIE